LEFFFELDGEEVVELLGSGAADFDEIVAVAGDVVALGDLGELGDSAKERLALAMRAQGDGDERQERQPQSVRIGDRSVVLDDAGFFKLSHAFGSGGSGKAKQLAEFGPSGSADSHQVLKSFLI